MGYWIPDPRFHGDRLHGNDGENAFALLFRMFNKLAWCVRFVGGYLACCGGVVWLNYGEC